ncbi:MAG: M28 family metallopeptidase [Pseudonocardia sp.]|nr:M28 family metallopeptidase [Pseudonocardia sp.]
MRSIRRRVLAAVAVLATTTVLAACADQPAGPGVAAPSGIGAPDGPGGGQNPGDPELPQRLAAAASGQDAFAHLQALERIADQNKGNRAVGTPGYDASVEYVAGALRQAGYDVATPSFDVRTFSAQDQRLTVGTEPVQSSVLGFSPATPPGGVTAPLFVVAQDPTSGCEAADFAGMPRGAIAVVLRGTCPFGQKSQLAGQAGAAGAVVVNTEDAPLSATLGDTPGVIPTTAVSKSAGQSLAGRGGTRATLLLATTLQQQSSRNVIAQTKTGDPNRVVMAGAHLDSVPEGAGINDNGSGSAALLEIAQKLGASPPTGQAVRFAWWGAEELGLVGSTKYVERLSDADRKSIAAYLNFDMVGSPNPGYLAYDGDDSDNEGAGPGPAGSAAVEKVLVESLGSVGVRAEGTDFDGRSDYGPFIEAGIPAGGLFTGAEERKTQEQAQAWGGQAGAPYDPCYHSQCDRLTNVDRTAFDRNIDAMALGIGRLAVSLDGIPAR